MATLYNGEGKAVQVNTNQIQTLLDAGFTRNAPGGLVAEEVATEEGASKEAPTAAVSAPSRSRQRK